MYRGRKKLFILKLEFGLYYYFKFVKFDKFFFINSVLFSFAFSIFGYTYSIFNIYQVKFTQKNVPNNYGFIFTFAKIFLMSLLAMFQCDGFLLSMLGTEETPFQILYVYFLLFDMFSFLVFILLSLAPFYVIHTSQLYNYPLGLSGHFICVSVATLINVQWYRNVCISFNVDVIFYLTICIEFYIYDLKKKVNQSSKL